MSDDFQTFLALEQINPPFELADLSPGVVEPLTLRREQSQRIKPERDPQKPRLAVFENLERLAGRVLHDRGVGGTGEELTALANHTFSLGAVEPPGKQPMRGLDRTSVVSHRCSPITARCSNAAGQLSRSQVQPRKGGLRVYAQRGFVRRRGRGKIGCALAPQALA